jgi:hypothetical protein
MNEHLCGRGVRGGRFFYTYNSKGIFTMPVLFYISPKEYDQLDSLSLFSDCLTVEARITNSCEAKF